MPLTVLIAPDSFKGSLPAEQVAEAIADGWRSVRPDDILRLLPQADGGEGTLDAVLSAVPGAQLHSVENVTGPDGRPTLGQWVELPGGTALVELAQMCGLPLMATLDAPGATTRGLGEVIRAALEAGATSLLVGLGGSASTDGGSGALSALGLVLRDSNGDVLPDGGGNLALLEEVDVAKLLPAPTGGVTLLSDVTAPLLGSHGAAAVFAPQKGADPGTVDELEAALVNFHSILGGNADLPGSGAAGGTGYGFASTWGAIIRPGWDYLTDITGIPTAIDGADVLLTGEGRFDEQSARGKVVGQLLSLAGRNGLTAGVIAGQLSANPGVWGGSLTELAGSVDAAIADPTRWLHVAGAAAATALTGSAALTDGAALPASAAIPASADS